jgi:hypothetical protein
MQVQIFPCISELSWDNFTVEFPVFGSCCTSPLMSKMYEFHHLMNFQSLKRCGHLSTRKWHNNQTVKILLNTHQYSKMHKCILVAAGTQSCLSVRFYEWKCKQLKTYTSKIILITTVVKTTSPTSLCSHHTEMPNKGSTHFWFFHVLPQIYHLTWSAEKER